MALLQLNCLGKNTAEQIGKLIFLEINLETHLMMSQRHGFGICVTWCVDFFVFEAASFSDLCSNIQYILYSTKVTGKSAVTEHTHPCMMLHDFVVI